MVQALGEPACLLMLPLEQLSTEPDSYLRSLSAFVGEELTYASERANVRSAAPDRWKLTDNKAIKRLASGGPLNRVRAAIRRRRPRQLEFNLTPELSAAVLAKFSESNQRVASALSLDLSKFGYFG